MNYSYSYLKLNPVLYTRENPTTVSGPQRFLWNQRLQEKLNIEGSENQLTDFFSGNVMPDVFAPAALAYAGHQFGHFVPQLGDGRAHLVTELTDQEGKVWDVQLKGSGRTSFSRDGDGRYALGPAIREYIMSEAMVALGIPTTESLGVIITEDEVMRQQLQPGAVLTRIASSHIRVGTFQYVAARGDVETLKQLSDHTINRHFPLARKSDSPYLSLLEESIKKQVTLIVEWMRIGLIHGVMNTDNTLVSGETIDYGPCAMLGLYDPQTVYSSIDRHGRYAFANQPLIMQWNMARFAECLLPLIHKDEQQAIALVEPLIVDFKTLYEEQWNLMMLSKLGINEAESDGVQLVENLLGIMEQKRLDYTLTFHQLTESLISEQQQVALEEQLGEWLQQWHRCIKQEQRRQVYDRMRQRNPVIIPRNHHMEAVIQQCVETRTADAAEAFLDVLKAPYKQLQDTHHYQDLPPDGDLYYRTFCGT